MAKKDFDYRKLNEELEEILASLETNQLEVDAAIAQYQRGTQIVSELQAYLKTAENKVKRVIVDKE